MSTWIYRIAVNTALLSNRKTKKRRKLFTSSPPSIDRIQDRELESKIEQEKQLDHLAKSIRDLKEQDRIILSLLLEGLTYKEIADILGITINHVGVKIKRSKERLRKIMTSKQYEH